MVDSPPRPRPNVLTIPAGAAFLPTLARGLLDGEIVPGFAPRDDPIALADATVFLPTRRAARGLRDAFLEALDGRATLLPRIAPLGDVDADEALAEPADEAEVELPPPAAPLERRLALARLVSGFAAALDRSVLTLGPDDGPLIPATAADAVHLAGELEGLIDSIEQEEVDLAGLDTLVPGEHDRYWAITQAFLQVALRAWPARMAEVGRLDPARRRRLQIDAAARRVAQARGPVIAAGSTGSAPATRRLIAAIAGSASGAVVLPGLDVDGLDAAGWSLLLEGEGPGLFGHPQRGLARLVAALGLGRDDIRTLGATSPPLAARARLVADALRPAETTDAWSDRSAPDAASGLHGVAIVEAPHMRGEAAAIAVALRETLETPRKTAALVTPDRDLAARVALELERWGVAVDDSAGRPLAATPAGALLRLAVETALDPRPMAILALLRAPACRIAADHTRAVDALDVAALRAPIPGKGLSGVIAALRAEGDERRGVARRFGPEDRAAAINLVERLTEALGPLAACAVEPSSALAMLAAAATHAYAALSGQAESEDATAVEAFLEELGASAGEGDPIAAAAFPSVLEALMAGRVVRPPRDRHPRVRILGPLEARLIRFDRVILGGLNEATWPPTPQADPWINRPLRAALGLPPPERRIGLSAHDFCQSLGADEAILTRSSKVAGAPAIPSRWLQRLAAVAAGPDYEAALARGRRYVELAEALDDVDRAPPARAPEPRPALALRPVKLSVTAVETWLRDPYAIYARHILRLEQLDPVGREPGPGDLGDAIHGALEAFARAGTPPDAAGARERLLAFGRDAFGPLLERDDVRALWWPRFERIADWLLAFQRSRAPRVSSAFVESTGKLTFQTVAGRAFTLTARADRIEALGDGGFALLDYKTGRVPSVRQALAGFAPQLSLEGAILRAGGFSEIAPEGGPIAELALIQLLGREPAGETIDIRGKTETPDDVAASALGRFKAVVDRFESEGEPYRSLSHPQFLSRPAGPYGHLARVKEWSSTGGALEGDAE
jgi:ATP-dependent helicase/nuclease subunit B